MIEHAIQRDLLLPTDKYRNIWF